MTILRGSKCIQPTYLRYDIPRISEVESVRSMRILNPLLIFYVLLSGISIPLISAKPMLTMRIDSDPAPANGSAKGSSASEKIEIIGLSVAYDFFPPGSRHLGRDKRDYDLIIKVVAVRAGKEDAKYIRLRYRRSKGDPDLPRYFNNGKSWWLLHLVREPACDQVLTFNIPVRSRHGEVRRIPAFRRPPGTESEPLPQSVLPCYLLQPGRISG